MCLPGSYGDATVAGVTEVDSVMLSILSLAQHCQRLEVLDMPVMLGVALRLDLFGV